MKYTYNIDMSELLTEVKEFDNDEQALAYDQDLFDNYNAPFITIIDGNGKIIGKYED